MEIWKVWKETIRSLWQVSDQGRVKRNGELYECRLDKNGYKMFSRWSVHRAIAELFIPNPENKPCVDHINGNKLDNRACNLRWVTQKQNCNNPITLKRLSEAMKGKSRSEEFKRKQSEAMKGKNKDRHRVYHDDGTYHYEKNL